MRRAEAVGSDVKRLTPSSQAERNFDSSPGCLSTSAAEQTKTYGAKRVASDVLNRTSFWSLGSSSARVSACAWIFASPRSAGRTRAGGTPARSRANSAKDEEAGSLPSASVISPAGGSLSRGCLPLSTSRPRDQALA